MNDRTDQELLRDYLQHRSEPAFAELVRRHIDFVYSAALRLVCNSQSAEDVTQGVFVALAQNASRLVKHPVLSGWLHYTARNLAANTVRANARRTAREQEAAAMNELLAIGPNALWDTIAPHLDAALGALSNADRDVLLLRYFEHKSAREMARILGTSEEAAQKRVNRAVERLRDLFSKRGIAIGVAGLVVVIPAYAVHAAPAGLAVTISNAALAAATAIQTSTAITVTKFIAMTTLQKALVTATVAVLAGTGIYEARKSSQLQAQILALRQQQPSTFTQRIRKLQQGHDQAVDQLAFLDANNTNAGSSELLKLRAEVTSLREQLKQLPSARVALLKQKFDAMPDKRIPELQFLTDRDWQKVAEDADLNTDDGVRVAMRDLRDKATDKFMNLMRTALKSYIASHDGVLPPSLLDLTSYFQEPVSDEILQHYQLMQTGTLNNDWSQTLVKKTLVVDPEYDSNQLMSMSGAGGSSWNTVERAVELAASSYSADHAGQFPTDASQVAPYFNSPIDAATVQKYLAQMNSDPPPPEVVTLMSALRSYANAHNGQYPEAPSALEPYVTTGQEKAALAQLMQIYSASHH